MSMGLRICQLTSGGRRATQANQTIGQLPTDTWPAPDRKWDGICSTNPVTAGRRSIADRFPVGSLPITTRLYKGSLSRNLQILSCDGYRCSVGKTGILFRYSSLQKVFFFDLNTLKDVHPPTEFSHFLYRQEGTQFTYTLPIPLSVKLDYSRRCTSVPSPGPGLTRPGTRRTSAEHRPMLGRIITPADFRLAYTPMLSPKIPFLHISLQSTLIIPTLDTTTNSLYWQFN